MLAYAGRAGDAREKVKEVIQVLSFYHSVYLLYWYKKYKYRGRAKEVEGGHPGARFLPLSLLALLVQKYKY
jgi:hypothetical protein